MLVPLFARRVVAVHENGVSVRLPFRYRFVPWRDVSSVAERVGARNTTLYTLAVRDVGDVKFPVAFAVNGGAILARVVEGAKLVWIGSGNERRAVRSDP